MCIDFKAKNSTSVSHRPDVEPQLHTLQVLVEVPAKGQGTNAARQICALHTSTRRAKKTVARAIFLFTTRHQVQFDMDLWRWMRLGLRLAAPQARVEVGGATCANVLSKLEG